MDRAAQLQHFQELPTDRMTFKVEHRGEVPSPGEPATLSRAGMRLLTDEITLFVAARIMRRLAAGKDARDVEVEVRVRAS